jgi:hypothetical protein
MKPAKCQAHHLALGTLEVVGQPAQLGAGNAGEVTEK